LRPRKWPDRTPLNSGYYGMLSKLCKNQILPTVVAGHPHKCVTW
jgi:hypothetical protein